MGDDVGGRLRLSNTRPHPRVERLDPRRCLLAFQEAGELAEQVGYERYWVAEHHNTPWPASSSPAVLVAHVAARTTSLRVGSGGVMFSHYAPLSVVEQFGLLEQRHPRSD